MFAEDRHNPWSRFAVPEGRTLELAPVLLEDGSSRRENAIRIYSDYLIRAVLNRRRPFRVLTQLNAGHAEDIGSLLYCPGVGQDKYLLHKLIIARAVPRKALHLESNQSCPIVENRCRPGP